MRNINLDYVFQKTFESHLGSVQTVASSTLSGTEDLSQPEVWHSGIARNDKPAFIA
jgi:hypothetical protein